MDVTETLSIWELVLNASIVVQIVMVLLLLASLASWVMIFQRGISLALAKRDAAHFEDEFWSGKDLSAIYLEIKDDEGRLHSGLSSIFSSGFKEFSRTRNKKDSDPDAVMQNVQRAMRVAMSREEERLDTHLAFLATVGSTSPYIGLFGTVWGIMNSFRGLATVNQASLSIVAPGISEALVATAMGLFAAIPAVIAYNRYSAQVELLVNRCDAFIDEFSSILHRAIYSH
jgi:biopolymer transport protein TolQ